MTNYLRNSVIVATSALLLFIECTSKDSKISELESQNKKALNSINAMNNEPKDKNAIANSLVPLNTKATVQAYQRDNKLSEGALTLKTLKSLGL